MDGGHIQTGLSCTKALEKEFFKELEIKGSFELPHGM